MLQIIPHGRSKYRKSLVVFQGLLVDINNVLLLATDSMAESSVTKVKHTNTKSNAFTLSLMLPHSSQYPLPEKHAAATQRSFYALRLS